MSLAVPVRASHSRLIATGTKPQMFRAILTGQVHKISIVLRPQIPDYMIATGDDVTHQACSSLKVSALDFCSQVSQPGLTDITV